MSELHRAALAFGVAASLLAGASAFAIEAAAVEPATTAAPSSESRAAVDLVSGGVAAKPAGDPSCPSVTLAPDGDSRNADGAKAKLDGLARDCANLGAETIVKVALVGESERKRAGEPAAIDAPMTILVRDAEGRDVETRRISLKVEMPEGVQKVAFRHVEENVSLPPPAAGGYAKWTIVVGFDPAAEEVAAAGNEQVAATDEEAVEKPVRAARQQRSKRYRSARTNVVQTARGNRRRVVLQPQQPAAPEQIRVTTTVQGVPMPPAGQQRDPAAASGGALGRAAAGFTERRDRALEAQRQQQAAQAAQQARQRGQRPPVQRPAQAQQQRPAPQPQASRSVQQPPIRTAGR